MEPGLEGNRPGRLNSPTILGHTRRQGNARSGLDFPVLQTGRAGFHLQIKEEVGNRSSVPCNLWGTNQNRQTGYRALKGLQSLPTRIPLMGSDGLDPIGLRPW
jgi:hypothetical protein